MILFGHQTGNPNAHHAALAHYEAGRLEAFVVPWFPSHAALSVLHRIPALRAMAGRLKRRRFEPLAAAPKIQGPLAEFKRLAMRACGKGHEGLSYEINDWLMRTMAQASHRPAVTAVHSYEDACLWSFQEAKKQGKACIYDMPIGYYPWWQDKQAQLANQFSEWLPRGGLPSNRWARPEQKRQEMELADLVLVPSSFVEKSIRQFVDKNIALAPYGVDLQFWKPADNQRLAASDEQDSPLAARDSRLNFVFAGQLSIRKGIPILLEAWKKAELNDATLTLVGSWQLAEARKKTLPSHCIYRGHVSREGLRDLFHKSDVFVFPTYFEGRALVAIEAMACALPILTTEASGVTDLIDQTSGRSFETGSVDSLVDSLRWFAANRHKLPAMRVAARQKAETCTWENYRHCVSGAVAPFV